MTTSVMLWGVLFGSIGVGYCIYGKKQRAPVAFVSGIALIGVPYFISNTFLLVAVCIALAASPFVIKP